MIPTTPIKLGQIKMGEGKCKLNSSDQDQRGPSDKAGPIEAHKWNHSGGKKEISLKEQWYFHWDLLVYFIYVLGLAPNPLTSETTQAVRKRLVWRSNRSWSPPIADRRDQPEIRSMRDWSLTGNRGYLAFRSKGYTWESHHHNHYW